MDGSRMDGNGRAGVSRSVRLQVIALAVILPAYGVAASLLGAPAWIALLYLALGIGLAALRVRLRRGPRHRSRAGGGGSPGTLLLPEPVDRAIGYLCVPSASNGDLREQTATVTRSARSTAWTCSRWCTTSSAPARPAAVAGLGARAARRGAGRDARRRASARPLVERRQSGAAAELVQQRAAHG